ncbi:MAG: preprotein translocase subunit SecE [Coriobacteriia bacterium]|nr:preprotein translocase subunit SecE [Coriobacteriia bacterium]
MATKSKTQRAKASEKRQAKKAARLEDELELESAPDQDAEEAQPKKSLFKKSEDEKPQTDSKPVKAEPKPKKTRFKFFRDVRSEMKRVTWPSGRDVLQWTGVVIVALVFFGVYVALLDNVIITPLLVLLSGLGA